MSRAITNHGMPRSLTTSPSISTRPHHFTAPNHHHNTSVWATFNTKMKFIVAFRVLWNCVFAGTTPLGVTGMSSRLSSQKKKRKVDRFTFRGGICSYCWTRNSCVLCSFHTSWTSPLETVCPKEQKVPFSSHRWQLVNFPPGCSIGEHFFLSSWHFMQELRGLPMVAMRYLSIGGLWDIERSCNPKIWLIDRRFKRN